MPTSREARPPQMSRLRMSRPCSSVPSRWPAVPIGASRSVAPDVSGSHGLMSGAASAAPPAIAMMTTPTRACRSRANARRKPTSAVGPRRARACTGLTASAVVVATSGRPRARIEVEVQQIDRQVHDHERQRDEERGALDHLHVARDDRADELAAEPRPAEDLLGEDGAAQQVAEL